MRWRLPFQIAVFLIVLVGVSTRNLGIIVPGLPEIQGLCPFGAVQSLFRAITGSGALLWFPAGVIIATLVLGPVFCGRVCPLGSVQEWIYQARKKLWNIPARKVSPWDARARWVRWTLPVLLVLGLTTTLQIPQDAINLSYAMFHVWTTAVPISALLILVAVLLLSAFVERPWCRWLCPWGAIQGTLSKISFFTIRRNETSCINCKKCTRACPFHIDVATKPAVRDSRCNRCERCVSACPVAKTLEWSGPRRRLSLPAGGAISAATAALLLMGLLVVPSSQAGTATSPPAVVSIAPTHTLSDIAANRSMDVAEVLSILGLPEDFDTALMIMDIEDEPGLEDVTVGFIRTMLEDETQ